MTPQRTATVEIRSISSEEAQAIFDDRAPNRPFNLGSARRWLRAMEDGDWEVSPDALSFNADGKLDNGQHRMWAQSRCSRPNDFVVLYHTSDTAFTVMDGGKKRGLAAILAMDEIPDAHMIASGVTRIHTYSRIQHFKTEGYKNVTEKQARDWVLSNYDDVLLAASIARRANSSAKVAKSIACATAYLFGLVDTHQRNAFFERLTDPEYAVTAPEGDPIALLRKRTIKNDEARESEKVNELHVAAWVVKAWNFYMEGESIKNLRWSAGGDKPERFPVIRGLDPSTIW